jgi:hypothetical protein
MSITHSFLYRRVERIMYLPYWIRDGKKCPEWVMGVGFGWEYDRYEAILASVWRQLTDSVLRCPRYGGRTVLSEWSPRIELQRRVQRLSGDMVRIYLQWGVDQDSYTVEDLIRDITPCP